MNSLTTIPQSIALTITPRGHHQERDSKIKKKNITKYVHAGGTLIIIIIIIASFSPQC